MTSILVGKIKMKTYLPLRASVRIKYIKAYEVLKKRMAYTKHFVLSAILKRFGLRTSLHCYKVI